MTKFILKSYPQSGIWVSWPEWFTADWKLIRNRNLSGRYSFLCRWSTRCSQSCALQISAKEWYQGRGCRIPVLFFESSMVRYDGITIGSNWYREQFSVVVVYFYDAPTPSGVFEDFLAIPFTKETVSTTIYDFIEVLGPLAASNGLRLVAQSALWWSMGWSGILAYFTKVSQSLNIHLLFSTHS